MHTQTLARQYNETGVATTATSFEKRERSTEFAAGQTKLIVAPFSAQLSIAVSREWKLFMARFADAKTTVSRSVMMNIIVGTLYIDIPNQFDRAFEKTAVIQTVTMLAASAVFAQVPMLLGDRGVMYVIFPSLYSNSDDECVNVAMCSVHSL